MRYLATANNLSGKALVRVDLNLPVSESGKFDLFRMKSVIPTLRLLHGNSHAPLVLAHFGRPDGKRLKKFSLEPVVREVARFLKMPFSRSAVLKGKKKQVILFSGKLDTPEKFAKLKMRDESLVVFLENIRFFEGEESLDVHFAKCLASTSDFFVNDAFSVSHHPSVSVSLLPKFLKSYAGNQLVNEITHLLPVVRNPKKPKVFLIGGKKVSDKSKMLEHFCKLGDTVLVGGAMANAFLLAKGSEIGQSYFEEKGVLVAKRLLRDYKENIVLPADVVVLTESGSVESKSVGDVDPSDKIFDIGPKTILSYTKHMKLAKTILWSGPMGMFEDKRFRAGSFALAGVLGSLSPKRCFRVIGGGETLELFRDAKVLELVDFASTGGSAFLEFVSGGVLPGIASLG